MRFDHFHKEWVLQWYLKVQWKWCFQVQRFNFYGSYLLYGCLASLIKRSIKKASTRYWIWSSFLPKWRYSDIREYSKNRFFRCMTNAILIQLKENISMTKIRVTINTIQFRIQIHISLSPLSVFINHIFAAQLFLAL